MLGFQPPAIGDEEIEAVAETLRSGWLTTGPRAAELERRFAEYVQAEHVLAVASGTAALHLALLAVGVGPGDEVITTPITWPATANVIVHAGATPVFADVRDSDLNIDPDHVAQLVGDKTKAIVPVDLAGQPADLDPLMAHGIPLVEDAAHAAESEYRGRKIGSIAEVTCFSLYATKNIAAGEGGLISTNDSNIAESIENLRLMRATRAIHTRTICTSSGSMRTKQAAAVTTTSGDWPRRTSRRASTSSRCTSSPRTASSSPISRRSPSPSAPAPRSCRSRFPPRTRTTTSRT
jgi:dTDP-4-amino-4,6-dideoxygalactose transaminase